MDDLHAIWEGIFGGINPADRTLATETIRVLSHYQLERSAAAYKLLQEGMVWDAEIIIRVIYETSAKIMLFGSHYPDFRSELLEEYWNVLPLIYNRKGAQKAEDAEKLRSRFNLQPDESRIFRLLQNDRVFPNAPLNNKRYRNEVEGRWSFSGIIKELTKTSDRHIRIPNLEALGHNYGIASHLSHASAKALDLMDDRSLRGADLVPLEAAHICRMLSDVILLFAFSLRFGQIAVDSTQSAAEDLMAIVTRMNQATADIHGEFSRSQDSFYANYD